MTVAHQSVLAVDSTADLACCVETWYVGLAFHVDVNTAVLVVECGEYQHWLFTDVDAEFVIVSEHRRELAFDGSFTVDYVDQWGVQP